MNNISIALSSLVLLVGLTCYWQTIDAQKTIANSYQQTVQQSTGSNPNSVYGGYDGAGSSNSNSRQTLVAPARQRGSYSASRQKPTSFTRQQQQQQQQPVYQQQQEVSGSSSSYESSSSQQAEADAEPASYGSVNGQAGVDFPNLTRVPKTSFSCSGQPYEYGMYADEETGCQAYHLCYNGRKDSFLCGPGTVFNQRILHCDYWYSVDCAKSSQYYDSNAYMGSSQPEPGPAQAQSSYKRTEASSSSSINRPVNIQQQKVSSSSNSYRNNQQVQEEY